MFLIIKWETKLSTKELNQRKKFQEKKVRNNATELEKKSFKILLFFINSHIIALFTAARHYIIIEITNKDDKTKLKGI